MVDRFCYSTVPSMAVLLGFSTFRTRELSVKLHSSCRCELLFRFVIPFKPAQIDLSGDSYSWSGYDPSGIRPNDRNPMGNPLFPGVTWCGDGPGWVFSSFHEC